MANLIDVDFLNNFTEVFLFLLIFTILYGVLTKIDFFKLGSKSKGLNSIIAMAITLLTLINGSVRAMIGTMVPWFFVLLLFIILMMISAMIFGVSNDQMTNLIKDSKVNTWIIIFGTIILLFSLGSGFGQKLVSDNSETNSIDVNNDGSITTINADTDSFNDDQTTNTGNYENNLVRTLFHPKVLGLMLIGIIGLITSIFLAKDD